jgi:hypothetical protein
MYLLVVMGKNTGQSGPAPFGIGVPKCGVLGYSVKLPTLVPPQT